MVQTRPKTHVDQRESVGEQSSTDETEYLVVKQPSTETAVTPTAIEHQEQNCDGKTWVGTLSPK